MMNRPQGRRNIPTFLIPFGRHLVYAEGTKTEPLYVEDLKVFVSEELKVAKEDIEIIPVKMSKSQHTVDLVEYAIKDEKKKKKKQEVITNVWIFYDKDDYKDFDEAYRLIREQDELDVFFPGKVMFERLDGAEELVCAVDGPIVLAGLTDRDTGLQGDLNDPDSILLPEQSHTYGAFVWTQNVYQTRHQKENFRMIPLYDVTDEKYTVYFTVKE